MYEPVKKLGQNFLSDSSLISRMISALDLKQGEDVIEIGPGHGIITHQLVDALRNINSHLFAVEIDERFALKLNNNYLYEQHVTVICEDILKFLPEFESDREIKIIGSLPYYITSPIIHKVIKMENMPTVCVFLVQKEVADKIAVTAPDSTYLSSFVQTFYDVEYLEAVRKEKFYPSPKVDGAVLKLTKKEGKFTSKFIEKYEGFLHRGFSNPRKMLNKPFTKEELQKAHIDPKLRPQNLNSRDWLSFYEVLNEV